MYKIAGVDEAGRGCAIGPLVVAGAIFDEKTLQTLQDIGVKDSKMLSVKKRDALKPAIEELAIRIQYFELPPWCIDHVVNRGIIYRKLNYLEAMAMANIIRELKPDIAYVDPADVNIERYKEDILRVLPIKPKIICESKADVKYPSVSAASILAKTRRDSRIADLRDEYGDFGSGYSSDHRTRRYIEEYFSETDVCPKFIRGSWATVKRVRKANLDKWL